MLLHLRPAEQVLRKCPSARPLICIDFNGHCFLDAAYKMR